MSQMKSAVELGSWPVLLFFFQISIQLTFIEQLHRPGNELYAFPVG